MDSSWLASQAQQLHSIFQNAFFIMLATFLMLAVVMELFKIPLGNSPAFSTLLGRALLAALLLVALPEIMNMVADATDSIAKEIGDLNNSHLVLSKTGEKLQSLSISWTSVKDFVTIVLSFLSFFALYITVYFADAAFLYCWTLIYVFSPLVLALYVFPQTAGATTAMFKSILEISLWKICWAVMAALLWSTSLSGINDPSANINWLTSIVLNLMLMVSVLMTPKLVRAIMGGGLSELASGTQGALMAAASLTPPVAIAKAKAGLMFLPSKAGGFAKNVAAKGVNKAWDGAKNSSVGKSVQNHPVTQRVSSAYSIMSTPPRKYPPKKDPNQKSGGNT
jgi:hypothetical protein